MKREKKKKTISRGKREREEGGEWRGVERTVDRQRDENWTEEGEGRRGGG